VESELNNYTSCGEKLCLSRASRILETITLDLFYNGKPVRQPGKEIE